jgi:hypothetical protein
VTGPFIYSLFHQFGRLFPRFVHWCVCFGGASRRSRAVAQGSLEHPQGGRGWLAEPTSRKLVGY